MTKIDRKKAFTVPQSVFKYPEAVVHCRDLSHDDKVTVLRNWKQELVQLQKAGEENMLDDRGSSDRGSSDVGSRLQAVTQAMIALGETTSP
jgi:hypothetical protein